MGPVDLQSGAVRIPGYDLGAHAFRTGTADHLHAQTTGGRAVLLRVPAEGLDIVQVSASYRFAAQTAQSLDGNGYVPCREVRSHAGRPVMVLEAGHGALLETLIPERGMRMETLIDTAAALARALNALHVQGVAHRDVTPDAVLVSQGAGACRFVSLETAALLRQGVSTSGDDVSVNPLYAAPEMTGCMEVAVDLRADLYALGAVIFRMAIGRPPYLATGSRPVAYAHITQPIPDPATLRPELPGVLCEIIVRLLQKDPGERYDTANGVLQDLMLCAEQFHRSGTVRSFTLGQKDRLSHFEISDKPYGRAPEIGQLLAACDLTRTARTRTVITVSGPSGIGKTTVVDRLRVPLAIAGVQFVTGKFDQFQRDTPYLAFAEVAANLARLHMRLGESERAAIRAAYREAVGDYGALLTELVPELREILGPQAEVPEVSPTEAEFRFNAVVGRFFRAMASPDRPMVMFIDDIQWADPASLRILEALAGMEGLENFIMILGYRSDEVTGGHPAAQMLAHTRAHVERFAQIEIGPLTARDVRDIMADALDREGSDIAAVADLVHSISSGNPFFVREFLMSLHDRGLIRFDPDRSDWHLDLERISDVSVPDSVAGMLTDRLADMPAPTLELLDIASCMGNAFDLLSLSRLTGRSLSRIASDLTPAVHGSLILPLGSNQRLFEALDEGDTALDLSARLGNARYRFRHDQARLAAHERMTGARRAELHMQIGKLMLSALGPEERERHAVEIFGHLEFGAGKVPSAAERLDIARIGLQASRASRRGMAFAAARAQLVTASALMPGDAWQSHRDLKLDLELGLAECAFALNDRAAMEQASQNILRHVTDPVKTAPLQILRVSFLSQQSEFDAAVDVAVDLARALGVKLPRHPSKLRVLVVALRALAAQRGKDLAGYARLPDATDPNIRSAMTLIANATTSAYFAIPNLLPIIGITGAQLSFKYGMAPDSPYCIAVQGLVYAGPLNMIERGCAFGDLALEIGKRYDSRHRARGEFVVNTFLNHWRHPYAQVAQDLVTSWHANRDAGEHENATYSAGVSLYCDWLSGRSTAIEQKQPGLVQYLTDVDMDHVKPAFLAWIELFRALQASDFGDDLKGELHDYAAELPGFDGSRVLIAISSIAAGILDMFAGRHARAEARFALAAAYEEQITAQVLVPALCFFRALNGYRLAQTGQGGRGVLRAARTCHRRLAHWCRFGEVNLARQIALLEAERAVLAGSAAAGLLALLQALGERAITDVQLDNVVEQDLSVVFADIRGFTAIARDLGPDRTIQMINRYLGHVQAGIAGNGGFVGNYMGDGLLALFPGRMDDALHGAIAMSRGLDGYNRDRGDFPELSIGLSVNRGPVTLGMIGDQDHIQCGVRGDAVNIASRIETLTKTLGAQMLIHGPCIDLLEDPGRFVLRGIGAYPVPGQSQPVRLYECLDVYPAEMHTRLAATRETFARAVALAERGDTDTAATLFDTCDTDAGGDRLARRLADRCRS